MCKLSIWSEEFHVCVLRSIIFTFREHIPGAVFFDLFKDVQNTDVLPRNVPEASVFEANAQRAGVNKDSHVIVYDSEGKCGFFLGSRAWWTFQVNLITLR